MHQRSPQPESLLPLMNRLRLLSAVGIAGVVAGVLVQLFGEFLGPRVPAAMAAGQVMTLPIAWVPLAALLVTVAWAYLLVGALHAPVWLRVAIGVAWAVLAVPLVQSGGLWAVPGAVAVLVLLAWRRWAAPLLDFGWRESLVFAVVVGATLLGALVTSLRAPTLPGLSFILAISSQLTAFTMVATPLLVLAGMDLAEVAGGAGAWVSKQAQGWKVRNLALIVGFLAVVQAGYLLTGGVEMTPGFGLTLAALALLLWLGGRLPSSEHLDNPPFPLLVSLLLLALAAPIGGILVTMAGLTLPVAGFLGSALLAVLVSLMLRRWVERRWPGAGAGMLVVSVWLAWLLAGSALPGWSPNSRALHLGIALVALVVAVRSWRSAALAQRLPLVLEVLVVMIAVAGIESAYSHDVDAGDIFTFIQVAVMIGSSLFMLLRRNRWGLLLGLGALAGLAVLLTLHPSLLDATQGITNLTLMALALIWGIIVAHRRMGELMGEGKVQLHLTFLLIGFSLMTVAILGWNRSLSPAPDGLTDFGFLAQFGLIAMGVPLYLLGASRRARD